MAAVAVLELLACLVLLEIPVTWEIPEPPAFLVLRDQVFQALELLDRLVLREGLVPPG